MLRKRKKSISDSSQELQVSKKKWFRGNHESIEQNNEQLEQKPQRKPNWFTPKKTAAVALSLGVGAVGAYSLDTNRVYSLTLEANGQALREPFQYNNSKNTEVTLPSESDFKDVEPGSFKGWYDDQGNIITHLKLEKDTHVEAKWYAMHTEEKVVLNETPFENIEETDDSLLESESYQKQVGKIGIDETRKQLVYRDESLYKESVISEKTIQPKTDAIWVKGTKPIPVTPTIQATPAVETVNQAVAKTEVKSEYYKNCTELRKVYPSGVGSDHAAYRLPLDRDRDGWACEAKGN